MYSHRRRQWYWYTCNLSVKKDNKYLILCCHVNLKTLGNHEFGLGVEGLLSFLGHVRFPVLSANTDVTNEPRLQGKFNKSCILTKGNERIGIIGFVGEDTGNISAIGKLVLFSRYIVYILSLSVFFSYVYK